MPEENVAKDQPTDICRLTNASPYLEFDLGSAQPIRQVWAGYHTAASGENARFRAATSQAGLTASPAVDVTVQARILDADGWGFDRHHAHLWLDEAVLYQWWRIDFDGPIDVGRVMGGVPFVPLRGMDFDAEFVPATERRAREVVWTLSWLDSRDVWEAAARVERLTGVAETVIRSLAGTAFVDQDVKPLLFTQDPEITPYLMDRQLYGVLTGVDGFRSQPSPSSDRRWRKRYVLEEMELP